MNSFDIFKQWAHDQIAAGLSVEKTRAILGQTSLTMGQVQEIVNSATLPVSANVPVPLAPNHNLVHVEGHDTRLVMRCTKPDLAVYADFLTPTECADLIVLARDKISRSRTVQAGGGEEVNKNRTSDGMFFSRGENELVRRIESRLSALFQWPVQNGEGLQVLRYTPGSQYRPHFDYFAPGQPGTDQILARGGQRVGTVVIYLEAPPAGGGTVFPDAKLEVMPETGTAVFFSYETPSADTLTLHGGSPVLQGEKWVATKWFRQREFT